MNTINKEVRVKHTYSELQEIAKSKFNEDRLDDLDWGIKYKREKSECPVGSPAEFGDEVWRVVGAIGDGCWMKRKQEGME